MNLEEGPIGNSATQYGSSRLYHAPMTCWWYVAFSLSFSTITCALGFSGSEIFSLINSSVYNVVFVLSVYRFPSSAPHARGSQVPRMSRLEGPKWPTSGCLPCCHLPSGKLYGAPDLILSYSNQGASSSQKNTNWVPHAWLNHSLFLTVFSTRSYTLNSFNTTTNTKAYSFLTGNEKNST